MALTSIATISNYHELEAKIADLEAKVEKLLTPERVLEKADETWDIVREKRDYLLTSTDWTMTPGASVDQAQWAAYRQSSRDLPQTYSSARLEDITWPVQPSSTPA